MAKNAQSTTTRKKPKRAMSSIIREEQGWGVRLLLKPFHNPAQNVTMEISAEIHHPKPGKNPEIRIWFSGVPIANPLKATDATIWISAITEINDQARKVAHELKEPPPKKKK